MIVKDMTTMMVYHITTFEDAPARYHNALYCIEAADGNTIAGVGYRHTYSELGMIEYVICGGGIDHGAG